MLRAFTHTLAQAQDPIYETYTLNDAANSDSSIGVFPIVIGLAIIVLMFASLWRVYTKAGKPGWATLIPIYNTYVLLKIVNRSVWWLLLFFVPLVNVVVGIVVYYDLVKAFGKGVGWLLLILFLPFIGFPMLAFGNNKYTAPKRTAPGRS